MAEFFSSRNGAAWAFARVGMSVSPARSGCNPRGPQWLFSAPRDFTGRASSAGWVCMRSNNDRSVPNGVQHLQMTPAAETAGGWFNTRELPGHPESSFASLTFGGELRRSGFSSPRRGGTRQPRAGALGNEAPHRPQAQRADTRCGVAARWAFRDCGPRSPRAGALGCRVWPLQGDWREALGGRSIPR